MLDGEEKEEEISIDLGKIKNIFRRKKSKEAEERKKPEAGIKEIREESFEKKEKPVEVKEREPKKEIVEEKKEDVEKEEDEEISIDFGKIKKFFKGKEEKGIEEPSDKKEEEIAIDLSKIKNIFKRGKKEEVEEKGEEEISFDIKKTINYFNQHKNILIPLVLILIAVYFSIYLRVMPAYLPITDEWARNSVHNHFRNQIKAQIDQQYPNLPDANKNALVDAEFKKFLKEQKSVIDQQVRGTSDYFKSRLQSDKGQTYLLAIDPYYWMRHAENVVERGHPGDEIRNGVSWDNHMYAPSGRAVPGDMFHAYFEAYLYKFLRFFNRDLELMKVAFYVPVLLCALAIIPAFFIAKRIGGNFGGVIAALIVAIHPSLLSRTAGGFADTDAYNVLFPLLITWLFLEAFETRDIKKGLIFSGISGFLVGVYTITWGGWWYIFDFILAASLLCIIYYIIVYRKEFSKGIRNFIRQPAIKNTFIVVGFFILSSGIFVSLFTNFSNFYRAPLAPLGFTKIKQVAITTIWPNVFTTVAEQNPASLDAVISQIGLGKWFLFLIALTGIALAMTRKEKKRADLLFIVGAVIWFAVILLIRPQNLVMFLILISLPIIIKFIIAIKEKDTKIDVKVAILLILWFTATIYATTKGVRFGLLLVPAFGVAFGVTLGILYKYLSKWIAEGLHINKVVAKIVIIVLLSLLLIGPYESGKATGRNEIPSMNDAWYTSLDKIRLESEPDAIINSWWDFGHWFKMIGDRAVTFDGTSQSSPQAHWIGNALMTDDEDIAIGILRMLDCSGYPGGSRAFDELDKVIKDVPRSINILYEVIVEDKEKAGLILSKHGLGDDEIDSVLDYTHCEAPENYFITSEDMIGKSGVWSHFGSWNFERALIYNTLKKKEYSSDLELGIKFLEERFNYTRDAAENLYYEVQALTSDEANTWIAPWPSYAGGPSGCSKTNAIVSCPFVQGAVVEINLTTMDADIQTQQGILHPNSLVYATKEGIAKKEFNNTVGVSLTLIPAGDSYNALIASPELAASMFTRLFYMEGHGLKHFKKFSDESGVTGGRIIVWKVDWEGKEKNTVYLKEPEIEEKEEINMSETNVSEQIQNLTVLNETIEESAPLNLSNES